MKNEQLRDERNFLLCDNNIGEMVFSQIRQQHWEKHKKLWTDTVARVEFSKNLSLKSRYTVHLVNVNKK